MALQHLRSGTANKRPLPTAMSDGQLAVNTNLASPGLFFKDSNGDLVKAGPVHVGTTAPNASPASTTATALVANIVYQILTVGTSDFTAVGASANTVGVVFTATGTTTGTGTVSGQQGNEKGEQWLDTTNSLYVMKVYDGTGWRVTDSISLANGSAAAPSLHFGSDTNTGIFSPGADQIAITTNGTTRLTVDNLATTCEGEFSAGNSTIGLVVLNDNATEAVSIFAPNGAGQKTTLNSDGSATFGSNVFIGGTTSANSDIVLNANGTSTFDGDMIVHGDAQSNVEGVKIQSGLITTCQTGGQNSVFRANTTTGGDTKIDLSAAGRASFAGDVYVGTTWGGLAPTTTPPITLSATGAAAFASTVTVDTTSGSTTVFSGKVNGSENVQINADGKAMFANTDIKLNADGSASFAGNVGIGLTSASTALHVKSTSGTQLTLERDGSGDQISGIMFKDGSGDQNRISSSDSNLLFGTGASNTERMRIDSSGDVEIGSGKYLTWVASPGGTHRGRIKCDSGDSIVFENTGGNNERMRIDSSGRLLLGTSAARTNVPGANEGFLVEGSTNNSSQNRFIQHIFGSNDVDGPYLGLGKHRGTSNGQSAIVSPGDEIGAIYFQGSDGTNFKQGAAILAQVDGTPGTNDMPGRLTFHTTADGAASPTERMVIVKSGNVGVGKTSPAAGLDVKVDTNPVLAIDRGSANSANFNLQYNGTTTGQLSAANGNFQISAAGASTPISFYANGSERMRIDSSGRVLVGTTTEGYSDAQNLTVAPSSGNGGVTIRTSTSNNGSLAFSDGTSGGDEYRGLIQYRHATNTLGIYTDATERIRIDSSGNVGIGNTTCGSILDLRTGAVGSQNAITMGYGRSANPTDAIHKIQWASDDLVIAADTGNTITSNIIFKNDNNERMRIDSSGRVLVGTSTGIGNISLKLQGHSGSAVQDAKLRLCRGSSNPGNGNQLGAIFFSDSSESTSADIVAFRDGGTWSGSSKPGGLRFSTTADGAFNVTERMRIDRNGTAGFFGSNAAVKIGTAAGADAGTANALLSGRFGATSTTGGGTDCIVITSNGNIYNTNNSYGSLSDVKLKENIVDANSQWDDIKDLRVRNYNFIEGQTHTQIGVVAQEVETLSPGLVTESPDTDDDGNDLGTVTKSVNYSVLYMKAVKALQEAMERIETLEQRLSDAGIA